MKNKHVQIRNKKYLIFIIVLLIFISIFIINLLRHNSSADYSNRQIRQNLSAISTFDYSKVSTIEDKIRKLEITEAKGTFDVTKKLTPEQYKKIFSTSVIMGDSVTEGIVAYGYLGEDHVFCKIGASIINGDEIFSSASKTYPGFAFCAFGMNDMGNYNGDSSAFIQKYKTLIKEFKKTSPDTIILVNGISAPSEKAIAAKPILAKYKKFNNALKSMCEDLNLTYIDNSYIIEDHPDFYASDGIHVSSEYYPSWLNNMILKAGL